MLVWPIFVKFNWAQSFLKIIMDNIPIRMKGTKRDEESLLWWNETVHFGSTAHLSSVFLLFFRGSSVWHHRISITKCTHILDVCTYKMGLLVFSPSTPWCCPVIVCLPSRPNNSLIFDTFRINVGLWISLSCFLNSNFLHCYFHYYFPSPFPSFLP